MSEHEDGKKLIEQRIIERKAAARLSLGPELLPIIMPLKICDGLLYDLGTLLQATTKTAVYENAGRSETWIECAYLFGELPWTERRTLLDHIGAAVKARTLELEARSGVTL